jgi:hypothetical protein
VELGVGAGGAAQRGAQGVEGVAPVMASTSRTPPKISWSWVEKSSWPAAGHWDISAG